MLGRRTTDPTRSESLGMRLRPGLMGYRIGLLPNDLCRAQFLREAERRTRMLQVSDRTGIPSLLWSVPRCRKFFPEAVGYGS